MLFAVSITLCTSVSRVKVVPGGRKMTRAKSAQTIVGELLLGAFLIVMLVANLAPAHGDEADQAGLRTLRLQAGELFHDGDYEGAIVVLEQVVAMDPRDANSFTSIAYLQWSLGNQRKAENALDRCAKAQTLEAYELAGEFYYLLLKQSTRALPLLTTACQMGASIQTQKNRARCLGDLGMYLGCWQQWQKMAKQCPNDPVIERQANEAEDSLRAYLRFCPKLR